MVFSELLGENPILNFVRDYIPYPYKHRTEDEHPLSYKDIALFTKGFNEIEVNEIQLLSMVERLIGKCMFVEILDTIDTFLLKLFPFLRRYCRAVIIKAEKNYCL